MKRILVTLMAAGIMLFAGAPKASAQDFNFDPSQMAQRRVERMKESLKINEDQSKALLELFKKEFDEMSKSMDNGGMPDMEKMKENQKKQDEAIKKILTPEQYTKYTEEQKKRREQFGGGGGPF